MEEKAAHCRDITRYHLRKQPFEIQKPDPTIHRDLEPGFLIPYLLHFDDQWYGRWEYWEDLQRAGRLPEAPIPEMDWYDAPHPQTMKMLSASLNCIPRHGEWETMGSWSYFEYFLDWLLFGLGHPGHRQQPPEPHGCEGAALRLYQVFNLGAMLLHPYEYFGDLLADSEYGKRQGFYPTPLSVAKMMTQMTFPKNADCRAMTMLDPCLGTGRFPLLASNHTLRLYGQDIDATLCKASLVNGYLYAPWMTRPIRWLDGANCDSERSAAISDQMTAQAPPQSVDYLAGTEHDCSEQWKYEPIKKRRKGDVSVLQGQLF